MNAVLRFVPGDGVLVRLPEALLFAAVGHAGLAAAFRSGGAEAATELAENDAAVPAFVALAWGDERVHVVVSGDIEVASDHRSLPRLSGAGSGTWVERTVRTGTIELTVGGEGARGNLELGEFPAAGFVLTLGSAGAQPPAEVEVSKPATATAASDAPTLDVPEGFGWSLRFEAGPVEPLDQPLVIGRRPNPDPGDPPGARLVQFECAQMSARHLAVRADAAGVWVTDLHSRNKSWVVTSGDHRLVALEPGVETRLDQGSHVQIGTKVFVVDRVQTGD